MAWTKPTSQKSPPPRTAPPSELHNAGAKGAPPTDFSQGTSSTAATSPPREISSGMIWWSKSMAAAATSAAANAHHNGVIGFAP